MVIFDMVKCKICGMIIESENLDYTFQFTLGNIRSGNFRGKKSSYYHVNCLNNEYVKGVNLPVQDT